MTDHRLQRATDEAARLAALGVDFVLRMASYLREMYPTQRFLPLATLLYVDLAWLVWNSSANPLMRGRRTLIGIASLYLFGLLSRMLDELKDEAIDRRFFPRRPLPSGRVSVADLRISIALVTALYLAITPRAGALRCCAILTLVYAALSYRQFFLRRWHERSLFFSLLTHAPLAGLILFYGAALGSLEADRNGWPPPLSFAVPISICWALIEGIEIARKVRAPEHEDAYRTYSKQWGRWRAVIAASLLQGWALVASLYLCWHLFLPRILAAVLLVGYAALALLYWEFLRAPARWSQRLAGAAMAYAMLVLVGFASMQLWRDVSWAS
jgi:4-hydroxybenzoate polyprenyltransferase